MRNRFLSCYILSLALCLGQLVTHAHIIDHFEFGSGHKNHTDHHAGPHNHSDQFVDFRTKPTSDQSSESLIADCGIYHVFVGMHGIPASYCTGPSERFTSVSRAERFEQHAGSESNDWHLIRGPPVNS